MTPCKRYILTIIFRGFLAISASTTILWLTLPDRTTTVLPDYVTLAMRHKDGQMIDLVPKPDRFWNATSSSTTH